MAERLKDRVAIVTGGGTGIGKAIARAFVQEGAKVVLAARTVANLEATAKELREMGGMALVVPTDVSIEQQVINMVGETIKAFGKIDIMVNNSGIAGPTANVVDLKLEEWNEILAIDLTGGMLCSREALKHMIPRRSGNIINVGAEGGRAGDGRSGYPMRAAYCCAKIGVIGLTETLAQEVGEYNIRVNAISAAAVSGERFDRIIMGRAKAQGIPFEDAMKKAMEKYALRRATKESELGSTAVFLASDESSAITGQTICAHSGLAIQFK
ncbi:MAG: SDR family oxidoreductase [Pseudomonadota bacterium]